MRKRFRAFVAVAVAAPVVCGSSYSAESRGLIEAAAAGDLARIESLIQAKSPLDTQDANGRTALLIAVEKDHAGIARALIAAGASVNVQAANMDTPWLLAGAAGRTEILRAMIPAGPDLSIRNRFGGNALIPACERGHVETIELLLTTKIDVNHVNNLGWTCLLEIVILGDGGAPHLAAAKLALHAGADPNISDKNGVSPLAHAKANGQSEVAALIEAAGGK